MDEPEEPAPVQRAFRIRNEISHTLIRFPVTLRFIAVKTF